LNREFFDVMGIFANESFIDQLITNQRSAIRYHLSFAIGMVMLGVAVIMAGFLWPGKLIEEGFKTLLSIGGGFVSSLSAFQLKEILHRKEKIGVFEMVKIRLHKLEKEGKSADQTERARIEELLWKLVEKTAVG
jgi:hypothetical protein